MVPREKVYFKAFDMILCFAETGKYYLLHNCKAACKGNHF